MRLAGGFTPVLRAVYLLTDHPRPLMPGLNRASQCGVSCGTSLTTGNNPLTMWRHINWLMACMFFTTGAISPLSHPSPTQSQITTYSPCYPLTPPERPPTSTQDVSALPEADDQEGPQPRRRVSLLPKSLC